VQNAVDHARCLAAGLAGAPRPYADIPWFWSDQGRFRLQIAGSSTGADEYALRGEMASGRFSVFCFRRDRLVGVESINQSADHMIARRLLTSDLPLSPREASDPDFDLKGLALRGARDATADGS
jgi:3-phenylpropionate/trans-cinnamate dioxygenase ferredoxin reductase subunit